jgi:hypothetical protein
MNPYLPCGVFQIEGKEIRMIDLILGRNPENTVKAVSNEFKRKYPAHTAGLFIYGDATSQDADIQKHSSKGEEGFDMFDLIKKNLKEYNPTLRVNRSNPNVVPRVNFMNSIFENNEGGITFVIDKDLTEAITDFEPKGNTGAIKIKDELEGPVHFSLDNSDIELDKPFFMKPNGSQQLLLRIRIPEGAPEGDYYYTLLASSEPPSMAISRSASGARATIGAKILITVTQSGYTKVNAKIALFDVLSHFSLPFIGKIHLFDSSDKVPVSLVLQNNGANFLKPEGSIEMRGNFTGR